MNIDELPAYVERMRRDVLAEALSTATAAFWQRRARLIAEALPREGDFPGRAPSETSDSRRARIEGMVAACEARAHVSMAVPTWVGVHDEHLSTPRRLPPPRILCQVCGTPTSPWTCSCGQTRVGDAA